jgi:hypothetical protein
LNRRQFTSTRFGEPLAEAGAASDNALTEDPRLGRNREDVERTTLGWA